MSLVPRPRRNIGVASVPFREIPSIVRAAETWRAQAERIAFQMIPNFEEEDLDQALKDMLVRVCREQPSPTFAACHILAYHQHLIEGTPFTEESLVESVRGFEQALRDRETPWMFWLPVMAADLLRYAKSIRSDNA